MAVHHFTRQAEGDAQLAHFVFKQIAQRLEQLEFHVFGQAADIVVRLDGVGFVGFRARAFDNVGVDGALRQPFGVGEFFLFCIKYFDEFGADDFAFALGVGNAGEFVKKLVFGVNVNHAHAQVAGKHVHHHLTFVLAQQAVIDEDTGELVADGAVNQRGGHGGIDAARQTQNHFVAADLLADFGHGFVDVVGHRPAWFGIANVQHKAVEQGAALLGVGYFGVELDAVKLFGGVFHHSNRAGERVADDAEAFRQFGHFVAVAHPHVERVGLAVRKAARELAVDGFHLGVTELALVAGGDFAAEVVRHKLHAVADA